MAALAGCSFTFMQASTETRPPQCYEQYEAPVTDLVIAGLAMVVVGTAVVLAHQPPDHCGIDNCGNRGITTAIAAYGLGTAAVFGLSSAYGFRKRARCEDARERWRAWCASVGSAERPASCDEGW
jgi:hypothetical protein